jgi:hypothetical protein
MIRMAAVALALLASGTIAHAQTPGRFPDLTHQQSYIQHRASSSDPRGANEDWRVIAPGATLTVLDADGPGAISHIWFTVADNEPYALKRIVLRMYWDDEPTPSVETPLGDFFGLGLGEYVDWQSAVLSVGNERGMNSYFPMPFRRHARIAISNEGNQPVEKFYFNIDYRTGEHTADADALYFHAQYRQAQPTPGWTNQWRDNGDPRVDKKTNLNGEGNYVWLDAKGHGQFVGVTMSVLQNQDGWWGEGDDMFLIDGETRPSIAGTGAEDYFLGAWGFGDTPFGYLLYGAPVNGGSYAGSRNSLYRFHLDSPIPFTKSIEATIEHGSANHRSDNYYSVAYWYQAEPHAAFPPLPPMEERLPAIQPVGGPGNAGGKKR